MTFTDYLISKKIDEGAFQKAEPSLFDSWKAEFEQIHPNSFTAQKLYLINPIRRKYTLPLPVVEKPKPIEKKVDVVASLHQEADAKTEAPVNDTTEVKTDKTEEPKASSAAPAKPARPVFKPKPKIS